MEGKNVEFCKRVDFERRRGGEGLSCGGRSPGNRVVGRVMEIIDR